MIRGLYTSGWGMMTLQHKMDIVANNMANSATTGFKKYTLSLEAFPDVTAQRINDPDGSPFTRKLGVMTLFNNLGEVKTDFSQGTLVSSGNKTDLAFNADDRAFFTVSVLQPDGTLKEAYTRDGAFQVTSEGMLVTKNGNPVMGENGIIKVPGADFLVRADGTVETSEAVVDRLKIKVVANPGSLRKFGANLLEITPETTEGVFEGEVRQGSLEQSNVDSVRAMVEMMTVLRAYESNQKMIQYQDATLDKACNEIGRVR